MNKLIRLDGCDGTGHFPLLHRTVTHNDNFLEFVGIDHQLHIYRLGRVTDGLGLGHIAHIRVFERAWKDDIDGIVTVNISDNTLSCSCNHDTSARQRISHVVNYGSRNGSLFLPGWFCQHYDICSVYGKIDSLLGQEPCNSFFSRFLGCSKVYLLLHCHGVPAVKEGESRKILNLGKHLIERLARDLYADFCRGLCHHGHGHQHYGQ